MDEFWELGNFAYGAHCPLHQQLGDQSMSLWARGKVVVVDWLLKVCGVHPLSGTGCQMSNAQDQVVRRLVLACIDLLDGLS